jgi:hypothetical protein
MSEHSVALKMDLHILSAGAMIFEDYGCGMTEQVLRTNYWAIKSSAKNTPEAKAAGLIGRFGIGALATLNLCKSLTATTTNIADGKTVVTTMDMTQEIPKHLLKPLAMQARGSKRCSKVPGQERKLPGMRKALQNRCRPGRCGKPTDSPRKEPTVLSRS